LLLLSHAEVVRGCAGAYGPNVAGPEGATTAEIFSNFRSACETNYPDGDSVLTITLTDSGSLANLPKPDVS
jgi:hypothetical protein